MQTRRVGLGVATIATVDILANVSGIFADFPGFVGKGGSMIQALYNGIGISGFALIIGLGMFAWGTWGKRIVGRFRARTNTAGLVTERSSNQKETLQSVEIWGALAETQQSVTELKKKWLDTEPQITAVRELSTMLEVLQKSIIRIEDKMTRLDKDTSTLLHNALFSTTYILVSNVLHHAPSLDGITKMNEAIEVAEGYVSYARRTLKYTRLFNDLEGILAMASNGAQARFSTTAKDEIPSDVHPETFRQFVISMDRCNSTVMFLKHHNRAMPEEESRLDMITGRIILR